MNDINGDGYIDRCEDATYIYNVAKDPLDIAMTYNRIETKEMAEQMCKKIWGKSYYAD